MNWKKIGAYGILSLILMSLTASFVAAQESTVLKSVTDFIKPYLTPVGAESTWTTWILAALALVLLFVVLFDLASMVLPFSKWVNIVMVCIFTIAALLLGLVRSIVSFGLGIGATLAGTGGAIAITMSGVLMFLAVIAVFFGGEWLRKYVMRSKGRRTLLEAESEAYTRGAKILRARREEEAGAGVS